jgi:hypothetical protein
VADSNGGPLGSHNGRRYDSEEFVVRFRHYIAGRRNGGCPGTRTRRDDECHDAGWSTHELTAAESGLATLTLKDGTEYGFRPTIQDSSPWNRIVVTIFRSATASAPTTVVGEIEVRRAGPAVDSKTSPSFKVSVPKFSVPTTETES